MKSESPNYAKTYRLRHPERFKESQRKYYESHREERQKYHRKWYLENRERLKPIGKAWRERSKDKVRKIYHRWRKNNPGKVKRFVKAWKDRNRDRINAYQRQWYKDRPHKKIHEYNARKARKLALPYEDCSSKIKLLKRITRFCHWCCRPISSKTVTIDHVLSLNLGGHHVNDNLVGCCKSCNSSKGDTPVHEWLPNVASV